MNLDIFFEKNIFNINKNTLVKYIFILIILFKLFSLIKVNSNNITILVLILIIFYLHYKYSLWVDDKFIEKLSFIKNYKIQSDIKKFPLIVNYIYKIKDMSYNKIYKELLKCLDSFINYYNLDDFENCKIIAKECLNLNHSLLINNTEYLIEFNNIIMFYLNDLMRKLNITDTEFTINRKSKLYSNKFMNKIEVLDNNFNNNFDYF
tara:strand:+ start:41 stop:658 length:618 start_codon:yes stop_codon:yes gene_type:complete